MLKLTVASLAFSIALGTASVRADTIVDVASNAGTFKTLLTAAKAAGLVGPLSGKGPLTVFAPTDAAFAKLPDGTVATLLKPKNKSKLAAILKYHVVSGEITSDKIKKGRTHVGTLQGSDVAVVRTDAGVKVNNARVIKADIKASNGVIHVIDKVLMPKY